MYYATTFNINPWFFFASFLLLILTFAWAPSSTWAQDTTAAPTRGAVLLAVGGCASCHTDTKNKVPNLAGGAPIKTPFGTFYAPNISSHPKFGIGKWTDKDFIRALREGLSPDGSHYYPAFPYTSFTKMTDEDMRAIHAHIMSLPPVAVKSRPHDLGFPFSIRSGIFFWKFARWRFIRLVDG
jgi:mono/diheme cytochrome c family protein